MDKEMEFKNKSIKEKVNGSFKMIIVLYVVSVALAVFLMFAVKIVPSVAEHFVLAGGIVVLAIITVCNILATLKRAKMLIHYIVEPVRELSSVAEKSLVENLILKLLISRRMRSENLQKIFAKQQLRCNGL